ncbi:hypothetical protein P9869_14475 [Streptomyces ossamyceticus]|nr:hypothetical protein [Streptomyces ossamyceticus]
MQFMPGRLFSYLNARFLTSWKAVHLSSMTPPHCKVVVLENHPEPLLGQQGEAFKVDGALTSVLLRRQDTGSGTWALTSRQEIHPDDFERTGDLLSWLATMAAILTDAQTAASAWDGPGSVKRASPSRW